MVRYWDLARDEEEEPSRERGEDSVESCKEMQGGDTGDLVHAGE